ncbi:MAG: hypothetical protein ACXABO_15910 [Promethearchaeota archaeon]
MLTNNYIGGDNWEFSDIIYHKLTGKTVASNYQPRFSITVKELPNFLPSKNIFGLFWSTPTFKDTDSNYLFHLYDNDNIEYVVSPSSGNTVEGMARATRNYNQKKKKNVYAILLVPNLSAYKVSQSALENNPYAKYVVLKNSTLHDTRIFAKKLMKHLSNSFKVIQATHHTKTAAYAQIGLVLKNLNLMKNNTCYVQTVSGGVGPAGLIEAAFQLKLNPEILIVQPSNGKSTPIVDALNTHSSGNDPMSIFSNGRYSTSLIEPTLGSTHPLYAIKKFIKWRENGGTILPVAVIEEELTHYKNKIINSLVKAKIYPNKEVGMKLFNLEKSGFIAFVGAIISANKIEANNIIVNFTGRYPDPNLIVPKAATPYLLYDPINGVKELIRTLNLI